MASLYTHARRIAVTGLRGSGKTVFITSLINHLQHGNPETFDLGNSKKAWKFSEADAAPNPAFPYASNRRRMAQDGKWPNKTFDDSRYGCYLKFDSWWSKNYYIEFRDFPGERFADVCMEGLSYSEWSDHSLRWWLDDDAYAHHMKPYVDLLRDGSPSEMNLILKFKRALYQLAANYKPLITPSTFLLRQDGEQPSSDPNLEEDALRDFHVGIDADSQFAPLTPDAMAEAPDLATLFTKRYDLYQSKIVQPLVKSLRGCDRLIVLVDIPTILQAGSGMLNDSVESLKYMFSSLQSSTLLRKMLCAGRGLFPLGLRPGRVSKVSFVAAKADKVLASDRDQLKDLLRDMANGIVARCGKLDVQYLHCSAVVSTRPGLNEKCLRGHSIYNERGQIRKPTEPDVEFSPARAIPSEWPDDWKPYEFQFFDVWPCFPKPPFKPPVQMNLDNVLRFLL